jgi:hypothetical protein
MNIGLMTSWWPTTDPDSGIGNNYHRLAGALAAKGHRVTVFLINESKPFWRRGDPIRENGFRVVEIPCHVLPNGWWPGRLIASHVAALILLCLKMGRELRNLEVMEVSSYGGFALLYYRFISLVSRGRPPILVRVSTTGTQIRDLLRLNGTGRYGNWAEESLIRSARHVCTHTQAHRDEICARLGLDPARMAVIPHGVVLPDRPAPSIAPQRFVLTVGRFEPRKSTDTLLSAIPLVLARQPECRFILVGGGEMLEPWTRRFFEEHPRLAESVSFRGRVPSDELETLYQTCDFFVSPALYESFGMTYLEAMRYGKPVIGCLKAGGAEEVIGDGGLLIRPADSEHLAETIIRLWTDRELHRALSARARLRAEYYSMERKAERTERHYAKMIEGET